MSSHGRRLRVDELGGFGTDAPFAGTKRVVKERSSVAENTDALRERRRQSNRVTD